MFYSMCMMRMVILLGSSFLLLDSGSSHRIDWSYKIWFAGRRLLDSRFPEIKIRLIRQSTRRQGENARGGKQNSVKIDQHLDECRDIELVRSVG